MSARGAGAGLASQSPGAYICRFTVGTKVIADPDKLSAPKSQRSLRFAIAMPIADPRNRAISETRDSNDALRFKGAMESR